MAATSSRSPAMRRVLLALLCLGSLGPAPAAAADNADPPKYRQTFAGRVPFSRPIQIPYIIDSADVDGDGHDDFAVGGKIVPPRGSDVLDAPKIQSFLVQNQPASGDLRLYDLGPSSLTHRTWAGAFVSGGKQGAIFVLGRNGEIGLPDELVGERTSIYRIVPRANGWGVGLLLESDNLNTTGSVAACDLNGDGGVEVYVNNVASALSNGVPPCNQARMYQVSGGGVRATEPRRFMAGMQTGDVSIHNNVVFADIDKDGDCDLLAAYEGIAPIRKGGPMVGAMGHPFSASDLSKHQSYVSFNQGGRFTGPRLLPAPPFGRNTSSFGIGGTRTRDGAVVVALDSSYLPSHEEGFSRFALQLFQWDGKRFVDVTGSRLSGSVRMNEANQSHIRFADIDGDGDEDFYLTRYDGGVVVFLQSGGRFVAKPIKAGGSGQLAVAFLRAAGKDCMDMAVMDARGRLFRFACS